MTSIQYLFNELWETPKDKFTWCYILNKAKEMHKKEIEEAFKYGKLPTFLDINKTLEKIKDKL
jgi:hypothetical protein